MSTIVTRAGKGSPLTHDEVDANFNNLNTDKAEKTVANTFTANQIVSVTNNTNAALRITQLGSGNALLVEDSTNPDASPFVIDATGAVIAGYTSAIATATASTAVTPNFEVVGSSLNASAGGIYRYSASSGAGRLVFSKSRTNTIGAQAIAVSGDDVGVISYSASDDTAFIEAARITASVDGDPSTNDMPGRLVFSTTANGASTPTERVRIDSAGAVGIGGTPAAGNSLRISKNLTGSSAPIGVVSNGVTQTDATVSATMYRSTTSTVAASFTLPTLIHFQANQGTIGATSAVTAQYGFAVESNLTGATNNYGFHGNITADTGRFNLYMQGTAANYFNGDLTVYGGTAIPAGGTTGSGYKFSSTTNFGVFFGSGAPTLSAAKGSLYLRSDGTTTNDRMYVNTDGSTTWTAVITAA